MRTSTIVNNLDYSAARLVQEVVHKDNGDCLVCLRNVEARLTAEDSHYGMNVILIHADKDHAWEPLCGYLREDWLAGKWGNHYARIYGETATTA
jgi:hypothetical protein